MIPLHDPHHALRPTAIALGSFDGLHQGHRRVIAAITADADGAVPTVVSFWPHPREVLHGETRLRLDLPVEKLELLEPLGVRQLVLVPFDARLAALSPEAFVEEVLVGQLQARHVAVGDNFRFGAARAGDVGDLARLGARHGMAVTVVPMLHVDGERVSSSRIRRALAAGEIQEAQGLLQRPYRFCGRVVRGRGLGRGLGWPTANLRVDGRKFLPLEGVYAAWAWCDAAPTGPEASEGATGQPGAARSDGEEEGTGRNATSPDRSSASGGAPAGAPAGAPLAATLRSRALPAVMNLGPQPTVDPDAPSAVEVHLLDLPTGDVPDLTGLCLTVEPVRLLRRQIRFGSLEELSARIGADAAEARRWLADSPCHSSPPGDGASRREGL